VDIVRVAVRVLLAFAVATTVISMLAFEEADRIGRQFLAADGQVLSISDMIGPKAWSLAGTWSAWDGSSLPTPAGAVVAHVGIDWFFIAAYLVLAGVAVIRWLDGGMRIAAAAVLAGLLLVDVAENSLLLAAADALDAAASAGGAFPVELALFLGAVEIVKTLLVAAFALFLILRAPFRRAAIDVVRRATLAVYAQRLSLVVVALFAAMTLLPPWHELLEQLPEVVRDWFDGTGEPGHAVAAVVTVLLFALVALVIGRARAGLTWELHVLGYGSGGTRRRFERVDATTPTRQVRRSWPGWLRYALWASPIPLVVVGAVVVATLGGAVDVARATVLVVLVGSLVGLSLGLEHYLRRRELDPARPPLGRRVTGTRDERRRFARDVTRAGDLLAGLAVSAGLLGVARSVSTPILVTAAEGTTPGAAPILAVVGLVALAGGVIAGAASLPIGIPRAPGRPVFLVAAIAALGSLVFLGSLVLQPLPVGRALGVVAVAAGSLGALTALVGAVSLVLRQRRPLALFEFLGLRSDPLILLLIVLPIAVAQIAGAPQLHPVDRTVTVGAADRPGLDEALEVWVDGMVAADCVDDDGHVPLVLIATQGGGVRAAVWTDAVLAQFVDAGDCAARSVFLSSGVSGGAVGLAVATTLDDPDPEALEAAVADLSRSGTLPAAVAGLIVSDPLASLTGVRVSTAEPGGEPRWRDRAALIEDSWRSGDSVLDAPWDAEPGAPTGYVVLNSTDILSGCRVSVSQLDLGDGDTGSTVTGEPAVPRCDQGQEGPPLTLDLLELYADQGCDFGADWATAAMLAARFPVVTPGGVVDFATTCPAPADSDGVVPAQPRLHLVDGGYAENSGIGLLADLAPRLGELIRRHNSTPVEGGAPVIVPYVVYIQNSPGADLFPARQDVVGELVVPLEAFGTRGHQNSAATWLQRAIGGLGEVCPVDDAVPVEDSGLVAPCAGAAGIPSSSDRVVLAAIPTRPSAVVPLGWALAPSTLADLFVIAENEAASCRSPQWSEYSCLAELVTVLPR
jgi:hypothetical protein